MCCFVRRRSWCAARLEGGAEETRCQGRGCSLPSSPWGYRARSRLPLHVAATRWSQSWPSFVQLTDACVCNRQTSSAALHFRSVQCDNYLFWFAASSQRDGGSLHHQGRDVEWRLLWQRAELSHGVCALRPSRPGE
ncbi:hypothetical protein SKAU_G00043250 [Synaphobranchus kaupii]|uniref:Uncharacterized protein n=1 Tax=Synaphobranchus kaupii TaxID=118154 RepID=A0A9Q1G2U7_SYNKA|nr:hypothetical protein SKAU_G00043250 [Synaphobranchus kaupii]